MAVHRSARRGSGFADDLEGRRVEHLVEQYGTEWLATARRVAASAADAEDAYQRAVEKLITSPPVEDDPERIAAWMHAVVKNEALQLRRGQRHLVDVEFDAITEGLASDRALPEERALEGESQGWAREALRRLRPDQLRCLLLRADGFDYPAICELTGFSYAKVNRLLSEGRKLARMRDDAIAAGHECERLEPLLSQFVDDVLDAEAQADLLLHLDHCSHCKIVARDYAAAPRGLAELFPVGALGADHGIQQRFGELLRHAVEVVQTRFGGGNPEAGLAAAKKAVAVVAVGATVVGGGVAIEHSRDSGDSGSERPVFRAVHQVPPTAARGEADPVRHGSRVERGDRSPDEVIGRLASDPATPAEPRQGDLPGDADPGVAEDPADRPPSDTPPDQSGVLGP